MTPEHKVDVVQTLERAGLVTAMVGDGVNDAAAIRAASVGIGVAARGSDAARTAADVVLLDERIEALLDALDEGQQLWRRVQSAVSMLVGGNLGEVCFALITTVLTGRSVLNARQLLLVNMLTDALPAAALAVSPQADTDDVDRDEAAMWRAIGIRGAATTIGAMLAWSMASATGTPRRAATVGADRVGRHPARPDIGRLAWPAGGAHDGRVRRRARGGGEHPRAQPRVRLHPGGPARLGSGAAGRRGGKPDLGDRSRPARPRVRHRAAADHRRVRRSCRGSVLMPLPLVATCPTGRTAIRKINEQVIEMERETRLQLKPFRSGAEHIDGAWWPRSQHLVDELPGLLTEVSDRLGPVVMIGYRRNGWTATPQLAEIGGRTVELLGFASDEPASVILIAEDGRHITLQVIRPDASDAMARQALEEAKGSAEAGTNPATPARAARSVSAVADKLARHEGRNDEHRTAQIRQWCEEAAEQFVSAPVQAFVPILIEHIVRNRMIESDGKPVTAGR